METINEKFYYGFEGEPEVQFVCRTKDNVDKMVIWQGYFEGLLSGCFSNSIKEGGLLHSYVNADGFYDESPWEIPDIDIAINELGFFRTEEVNSDSSSMISTVEKLKVELLSFLMDSENKGLGVYIDYN